MALFNKVSNEKSKGSGYMPMRPKSDSKKYASSSEFISGLPPKVDLRPFMAAVEDQGDTNSCTANAVAGACEYLIKQKMDKNAYDVSRLYLYFNARKRSGEKIQDEGTVIQYVVESLKDLGVCPETVWPFKKSIVNKQPSEAAYSLGQRFKLEDMENVPVELDAWKKALAEGHPIIFGTELYESFDDCSKNGGFVSMPSPDDAGRSSHSGHAMLCVGYSDPDNVFVVRNSWGDNWGDNGYCYMPYNYLINEKLTGDCWILRSPYGIENPKAGWVMDSKPINNGNYKTNVYDSQSYKNADDFYDSKFMRIIEYASLVPAIYSAIVDNFFDEKVNMDSWQDDHPDNYEFDEKEYVSDEPEDNSDSEAGGSNDSSEERKRDREIETDSGDGNDSIKSAGDTEGSDNNSDSNESGSSDSSSDSSESGSSDSSSDSSESGSSDSSSDSSESGGSESNSDSGGSDSSGDE